MTDYAVIVTESELAIVRAALGRDVEVKAVPARKAKAEPRVTVDLTIATGDDRLDAFMRRSRERGSKPWAPKSSPAPRFPFGCKQLTTKPLRDSVHAFNNSAVAAWRRHGYVVNIEALDKSGNVALDGRNVTVIGLEL